MQHVCQPHISNGCVRSGQVGMEKLQDLREGY